jgi:hypothetical protein
MTKFHQESVSAWGRACNSAGPYIFFVVDEFYGTPYQSGFFFLSYVGVVFAACAVFS